MVCMLCIYCFVSVLVDFVDRDTRDLNPARFVKGFTLNRVVSKLACALPWDR